MVVERRGSAEDYRKEIRLALLTTLVVLLAVNGRIPFATVAPAIAPHARLATQCPPTRTDRNATFLPRKKSIYSGMWWMSIDTVLGVPYEDTGHRETITSAAYMHAEDVVASSDWLDLSVEHLSKYVKHFDFDVAGDEGTGRRVRNRVAEILERYINIASFFGRGEGEPARTRCHRDQSAVAVSSTIAILPVHIPLGEDDSYDTRLTILQVAATIASLWNAGFPRMVVIGVSARERRAFARIEELLTEHKKAQRMELDYVHVHWKELPLSMEDKVNVPRAAVVRFQTAMRKYRSANGKGNGNSTLHSTIANYNATIQDATNVTAWLGPDPARWANVYFSEPDLLLHLRPDAVPAIGWHLERGELVAAHRLNPVPHMRQFRDIHENATADEAAGLERMVLPDLGTFAAVHSLDEARGDACCDQGRFYPSNRDDPSKSYPVRMKGDCSNNWVYCGFTATGPNHSNWASVLEQHEMLLSHSLVSLKRGTGIPLVQSSQRACTPLQGPSATCQ